MTAKDGMEWVSGCFSSQVLLEVVRAPGSRGVELQSG